MSEVTTAWIQKLINEIAALEARTEKAERELSMERNAHAATRKSHAYWLAECKKAEAELAAMRKELEVTHTRLRTAESARDEARTAGRESGSGTGGERPGGESS